ncbi:MAG: VWA domain-containing protein [Bacteroidetes bacterium]|nr:VWA domain-containing protein [Bacteroidota bacterium]
MVKKKLILVLTLFMLAFVIRAQPKTNKITRVLFVFDASNSMKSQFDGKAKMDHAKKLFNSLIDSLSKLKNYEFALRMYGSTVKYPPGDCNDTKLIIPFSKNNIPAIKAKVNAAKPTGITPIEHSLISSANDFPDNKNINTIILITDGIEECGGDPCAARQKLYEKGIIFKPCIIGIGLTKEQAKTFECVGNYFSYDENSNVVSTVVNTVSTQTMNKTSVQVNLLDLGYKPNETNVNMTFYDEKSGMPIYNYVHSINKFGNPDTVLLDEFRTYKLVAHTIPPVEKSGITLSAGIHNIIALDAPQGLLELKRETGIYNYNEKVKCIVRKKGEMNTLHVQPMNTMEKYIVGQYDLEVLTLPRTYLYDVSIQQTLLKTIYIEDAGMLKLKCKEAGDGCIMQEVKGVLKWVCNIDSKTDQTFYLQPGDYRITYRSKTLKQSIYTIEKKFTVVSNEIVNVDLFKQ